MDRQQQLQAAKQSVARWFDRSQVEDAASRARLLAGVGKVFEALDDRANWFEAVVLRYPVAGIDEGHVVGKLGSAVARTDELLSIAVLPGWGYRWSRVLRDEDVRDTLSWLLHFARQYVQRAWLTALSIAIHEQFDVVLHPFSWSDRNTRRYSDRHPYPGDDRALQDAWNRAGVHLPLPNSTLNRSTWINANTLDPDLQQGAAHYLRASALAEDSYCVEAIVAYDCVVQSCASALQKRKLLAAQPTRTEICAALGLGPEQQYATEFAYFVRNNFGAHPRGWRWWDAEELVDGDFPRVRDAAKEALLAISGIEQAHRLVEMEPPSWSDWLRANFTVVFDAVWFDSLAEWSRVHRDPAEPDE